MTKPDCNWKKSINTVYVGNIFNLKMLECPCCNLVRVSPAIAQAAGEIMIEYTEKVVITSGYRCELHNMAVGGEWDSRHLFGEAIDVGLKKKRDLELLDELEQKYKARFKITVYKDRYYLHLQEK